MKNHSATPAFTNSGVGTEDLVVIVGYLVLCLLVGAWATWKAQKGSITGYFLAGREMRWFAVGASLYTSDMGSGSIVGMAGQAAASGIAVASYELTGISCVLLLGWLFVPVYIASGVYTLPGYLKKRFGGQRLQIYLSVLSLLLYVFTKLSVDIYACALFIKQSVGWNMYLGILVMLGTTAIYTVSGGLKAVIYTNTLQTAIMLIGSVVLMVISFQQVSIPELQQRYQWSTPVYLSNMSDSNINCGSPPEDAFHLLRDASKDDLPWPGSIIGVTILGVWYFCADQVLVQRSLAAKNMHHVKGGSIMCSYLKLLPLFTVIFPGMISRVLYKEAVACADTESCEIVCENKAGCTNIAYPKLIVELMPIGIEYILGLKGVMLAAMMAALMSSVTSVFNSSSTIFTMDIWKRIRPTATDAELLVVGRMFVMVLVAISVIWIPVLQSAQGGQLYNYMQSTTGYLTPPVTSLFIMAIFWKRTNETGAFWGVMIGLVMGVIRVGLEYGYGSPVCGEPDNRPAVLVKVHFLHFTILLLLVCLMATAIISAVTQPDSNVDLTRLTWWTRHHAISDVNNGIAREEGTKLDIIQVDPNLPPSKTDAQKYRVVDTSKTTLPLWRRIIYLICGYGSPDSTESQQSDEIMQERIRRLTCIKESPKWSYFVNINCIILLTVVIFIWGFFA